MRKEKCLTVIVRYAKIGRPGRAALYTESDPDDDGTFFINARIDACRKAEDLLGLQVVKRVGNGQYGTEVWEVIT